MKKTITILLTIAMLFTLCACGKKEEAAPGKESITGKTEIYGCFSVLVPEGMELEPGDLLDSSNPDAFTVRDSEEAFRYILVSANDEIWIDEGMDFTKELNDECEFVDCSLPLGNTTFTGFSYVSSGVDCLELKGCIDGVFLQVTAGLVKPTDGRLQAILESIEIDPAKAPKTDASDGGDLIDEVLGDMEEELLGDDTAEEPAETLSAVQQRWNGWWYGGLDINGCTGGWSYMNNATYDAAMYIDVDADGAGTMYMFEYGQLVGDDVPNCFAVLECHGDANYLYADSGEAFSDEINPRDWMFVPFTDNPDKIGMGTSFTDEDGDRFGYDLTLMPWGSEWEGEEDYTCFIPGFDEYLYAIYDGQVDPYGNYEIPDSDSGSSGSSGGISGGGDLSGNSALLGSDPEVLDINDRGIVTFRYPGSEFTYDSDYGKLESSTGGASIAFDPCLGASNVAEYESAFRGSDYTSMDDYELYETKIGGCRAIVCRGSDWFSSRMNIVVDFGGSHGGFYGLSITISGDSLDDCDTDLVWAVINSMALVG